MKRKLTWCLLVLAMGTGCSLSFQLLGLTLASAETGMYAVQIDATPTPKRFKHPEPIILKIRVRGLHPVSQARVWADVQGPVGSKPCIRFRETGGTSPYDVVYSGVLAPPFVDGTYQITIYANDNQGQARFMTGFESESRPGTETPSTPPPPLSFEVWHAFEIKLEGYDNKRDFRPQKVTDLHAQALEKGCYRLSWTAPLGLEPGWQFVIMSSPKSFNTKEGRPKADVVIQAPYTVKGGDHQTKVVCLSAKGRHYLAVRSLPTEGDPSEISNDFSLEIK